MVGAKFPVKWNREFFGETRGIFRRGNGKSAHGASDGDGRRKRYRLECGWNVRGVISGKHSATSWRRPHRTCRWRSNVTFSLVRSDSSPKRVNSTKLHFLIDEFILCRYIFPAGESRSEKCKARPHFSVIRWLTATKHTERSEPGVGANVIRA
jgi:hypothetical protein